MNRKPDRREFAVGSAAIMAGSMLTYPNAVAADEKRLADKRLVTLGINALARSHRMNYFGDGHRGAAMISAHMMCVDNKFDDPTASRIVDLFDKSWANTKLCEPFPEGDPVEKATEKIGKALAEGGGGFTSSWTRRHLCYACDQSFSILTRDSDV